MAVATPSVVPHAVLDHIHPAPTSFVRKYVFSIDAKVIGVQYMITGLLFFVMAGLLAELIRIQLLHDNGKFLSNETYNAIYSMHGSAMVWMVIIPLLTGGFGNFVMPLQIGARDVAFPWLNLAAFWMFPVAGVLLFGAFLIGAPDAGWTEYPPVSLLGPPGTNLWCIAIFLIGVSSTMTGINFIVTIIKMRAPGMTLTRMPLFVWAQLSTAALSMIATTALSGALAALFLERVFGVPFYDPSHGGSPVLWQHMFWFYSHPAVYIMILPAFGIISEILPTFARKPIFGYKMIAFSSVAIALLGFMVWGHHMFTSGLSPWLQLSFMILTMIVAIPTGVKIFSWMATLWGGSIEFTPAMLFAVGFLITFTFGGITGVFLAAVPVDLHASGTYFIIAHCTFLPMHWLGLQGMPRRYATYSPAHDAVFWNVFASCSSFVLAASTLLLFINMWWSFRSGKRAGANPWGARTLEWMISSPAPYYNYKTVPAVLSTPYDFGAPLPYIGLDSPDGAMATSQSTTGATAPAH
jgi:cytochrome c oxidase subunit I